MTVNPKDRLESLRERIDEAEEIDPADQERLREFSDELYLRSSEYSDHRHEKLLRHCVIMAEQEGRLAESLENKRAAKHLVRWINQNYDNYETNRDYRLSIRVFGRILEPTEDGNAPESIEWIPSGTPSNYDPSPDPREMLDWEEEVVPMIQSCHNNRDRALIALAFDAGPRGGELKSLCVGDIQDGDHGLRVTLEGKQGRRTVTLIPATSYVNRWLADHPRANDHEAPLWCGLHDGESISDRAFYKILQSAAERVDVTKPVTPTNFRKSSASYLASKGMSQAHLEDHHGWVRGSKSAARYISVFANEAENELARIHGLEVAEEDDTPIGPLECPRCEKQTPRERDFCVWCKQALDPDAEQLVSAVEERTDDELIAADDPEEREVLVAFRQWLRENPDALPEDGPV